MEPRHNIEHILVPHDFSVSADDALHWAAAIAQRYGARITVMHVYDISGLAYPDAYFPSLDDFLSEVEQAAAKSLRTVASRFDGSGLKVETVLRQGAPAREIVAFADQIHVDLIVMGTHGRRGASRLLMGSVAEKVVRTAACPVLTVPSSKSQDESARVLSAHHRDAARP